MTDRPKKNRLSREILGLALVCILLSGLLGGVLYACGIALTGYVCEMKDITLTDTDYALHDGYMTAAAVTVSALFFTLLFLILLGERLVYIKKISDAVSSVTDPDSAVELPLEGSNELADLARAINEMSRRDKELRKKEKELNEEREALVRSLSHDIRTPLTSVMSYSQLLLSKDGLDTEAKGYADSIHRKAQQIKELTDVLLDGGKREITEIADIRLLCEQLLCDLTAELEDDFDIITDLKDCDKLPCKADISEIRRIFDNLASNISKYADGTKPVFIRISTDEKSLVIEQKNTVADKRSSGHGMGLRSIRRIASAYGGEVNVDAERFVIIIKLPIL